MDLLERTINHITNVAEIPSFSSYEERLHPYINGCMKQIPNAERVICDGNNLIWKVKSNSNTKIALTAHLDKINHYGQHYPSKLPVVVADKHIEGAMDDSAGVGIILALAELGSEANFPDLLLFFSEMEESKGMIENPELLKDSGKGYNAGQGARMIGERCLDLEIIPEQVITIDTTPLFKGKPGMALYSNHWELNKLEPTQALVEQTASLVQTFLSIDANITLNNNTNDYLHYGKLFNQSANYTVPSVALEPAIFPYHQKGERVFKEDIERCLSVLSQYFNRLG